MPSVHDFKKTNKSSKSENAKGKPMSAHPNKKVRRPGRDHSHDAAEETVVETKADTTIVTEEVPMQEHLDDTHVDESNTQAASDSTDKVEIHFPGSEILRAKWSKPFEVAEKIATEWKKGGDFENLDLGNPVAEAFAASGLRKAKELEKKVVDSGVIEKVATEALTFGLKAQQEIQTIREQVRSKIGKK